LWPVANAGATLGGVFASSENKPKPNQNQQTKLEFLSSGVLLGKMLLLSTRVLSFAALQSNFQA